MPHAERILIIKLSALGDFILSLGACQAIRKHHPDAKITLLTTKPYESLAKASGLFDEVWLDSRPRFWQLPALFALRGKIRDGRFKRVYDLQRNDRSASYFRLIGTPKPQWVGKVSGCSHRYLQPNDQILHISTREAQQLALAGISNVPASDLTFADADLREFALPPRYVLLVPGGAPHRPAKRWPMERYAELAQWLVDQNYIPVLLGTAAEQESLDLINATCSDAINLCGRTNLLQIATLAKGAVLAVGNDTGPMHLIAPAGCPMVSLFSHESDPTKVSPRGNKIEILRRASLEELSLDDVIATCQRLLPTRS
ncbi:glycosyltransferase family 9 protein [Pelagibius sp. Alg239-R121]|uniref:glycosyltransferase family 9 protein n=1 Tax=Pelagibius sp. Alg239-R121 TaxID=2993448 RepID=UPI0024A6A10F|nr:glycosyltransferase family 9 protein [Pelagibius sp. Alg239-R121]